MKKKSSLFFIISGALFLLFALFTPIVALVDKSVVTYTADIQAEVGLSGINQAVFKVLGGSSFWYDFTELLGMIALGLAAAFALLGLYQLTTRRHLSFVDYPILLLGALYALVIFFYFLFEVLIINYRPILMDGVLEASYPSSHSMLALCVFMSAPLASHHLIESRALRITVAALSAFLAVFTAIGRLLSGAHWFTDILGSLLLSAALVSLYTAALLFFKNKINREF